MNRSPCPPEVAAQCGALRTCSWWRGAFLTCEPNRSSRRCIPRRCGDPQPEHYDRWLEGGTDDACGLAQPFPSQLMAVN